MMPPDVIPPEVGIPAALLLWAVWGYLKWCDHRATRRATNHQNGSQRP